jgi:O-antigen ligase
MGLFFTLLYILGAYLGPETLYGPLADYHIQLIIAVLALVASIPSLQQISVSRIPQTYALIGMCIAVLMSFVFNGLTRYSPDALFYFLPTAFTFFFVLLNCKTKRHLQMLVFVILCVCLFSIFKGSMALWAGNVDSPYLITQTNMAVPFSRLRGLAAINDPNDFSQLIVSLIPCLFFFWAPKKTLRNFLFVLIPAGILLFGMFLTHSRGGILAFLAVVVVASRRKIGTIPSVIIAGCLFAVATVVGWSGGRDISVESGADRLDAWGTGLELLKFHPLFGVGFQRFTEHNSITAHNTIVVCAAELGMVGLFFWVMFVILTLREATAANAPAKSEEQLTQEEKDKTPFERTLSARTAENSPIHLNSANHSENPLPLHLTNLHHNATAVANPYFMDAEVTEQLPEEEIRRLARIMPICLTGFLVAGWFLSRAYVMTLFIYGGMTRVIYQALERRGQVPPPLPTSRLLRLTGITCIGLITVVYIIMRVR